jgi:uroporphyrinogen III methyltransferase/synthase
VIGPTTENAARSRGLKADLVPAVSDGAALGEALRSAARGRLLLLRAEKSAPDLTEILRDGGLNFDEVPIYRTVPVSGGAGMANVGGVDAVAFTSASSVRNFLSCCPELGPRPGAEAGKAACIGGRTAQAAIEAGYEVSVAKSATLEDLADAIEEAVK